MTVDELQQRDRRIETLEALGRARTREQDHELGQLWNRRDLHWRRLPERIAAHRARAAALEAYAAQAGFAFS